MQLNVPEQDSLTLPKKEVEEAIVKLGFIIQNTLYNYMLKDKYTIKVQPTTFTNQTLFASGLSFNEYKKMNLADLAKLLQVDAVIYLKADLGKINYKNLSVFIGIGSPGFILLGGALTAVSAATAKVRQTDNVNLMASVIESEHGLEIWNKQYQSEPKTFGGLDDFFSTSLKNVSKKLLYKK